MYRTQFVCASTAVRLLATNYSCKLMKCTALVQTVLANMDKRCFNSLEYAMHIGYILHTMPDQTAQQFGKLFVPFGGICFQSFAN